MNIEILNQTETLFDEVSLLYNAFNCNPSDGLKILRGDERAVEDLRAKYAPYEMPSLPQIPCSIVFVSIRKQGSDLPDVWRWLYRDRVEILNQQRVPLERELSLITSDSLIIRLSRYKHKLDRLINCLNTFAGKGADDFQDLAQNTSVDWSGLFSTLNGYLPSVIKITRLYLDVLTPYLPNIEQQGQSAKSPFKLSDKRGAKTDIIRMLNAMYDLYLLEMGNGQPPTKQQFMQQIGGFMGVDLSDYNNDLKQAFKQSLEVNSKIFDDLKKNAVNDWLSRQNGGK